VTAPSDTVDEVDLAPVRTYWQLVRRRFLRHRLAVISLVILAALIAYALLRKQYAPAYLAPTVCLGVVAAV